MINGIEVQQAAKPFHANGREYAPGTWVILMDQPFSPLVKELFERAALSRICARRRAVRRNFPTT